MTYYIITIFKVILVGYKKLAFYINKIELGVKYYRFILHSLERDLIVTKITTARIDIETRRIGIS